MTAKSLHDPAPSAIDWPNYSQELQALADPHPFIVTRAAAPKADAPKVRYVVNRQGIILSAEFDTDSPAVAQNIADAVQTHNAVMTQKLGNTPIAQVKER